MHWPIVDSQTHDTKLERPGAYTPKDGIGIVHSESGTLGFVLFAFHCVGRKDLPPSLLTMNSNEGSSPNILVYALPFIYQSGFGLTVAPLVWQNLLILR